MNAENISSIYSNDVITYGDPIHKDAKDAAFSNMCDFPENIKFPKWSCVLNCCSGFPGVFVPGAEMNYE